ncbi:hypothetical protein COW36_03320 [bacterium (Candidatus Blackallbacteria) CG17_big_fil_post_rev_8_21_14_2_50_48_46]|uniref:Uncharacterized protein n=1 Tax=bacterium (Candidatus Blackallbacteria) CG17_big_fil_post_rev_8_21_14_2_50_48_46 TaxID=2014261 RepID=A0A2M7G9M5_9BACT|nr:MAG: hypothetical protein COW64_05560 [bacterium (Candidatus Blackallbacteria) CG18_big_fil_WC_8_21_14_2_50_49_26]PIW18820.1 MAG: hypothetical protein COW36_03320 [bacterium (Candidatus Blackallbacteria) CG17_big_fil_post_rev_8_21_14_2_50_48_46]PIW49275.1 MAG: hypothetical protein COW20_06470 [bacterium (Candidatus Blackallbacteria) CG13_big_fil_rev_8_21_14_2_50_49_14]
MKTAYLENYLTISEFSCQRTKPRIWLKQNASKELNTINYTSFVKSAAKTLADPHKKPTFSHRKST